MLFHCWLRAAVDSFAFLSISALSSTVHQVCVRPPRRPGTITSPEHRTFYDHKLFLQLKSSL